MCSHLTQPLQSTVLLNTQVVSTRIDVSAAVLPGHGLGQPDHSGLGSAVVGLPDVADDPGD
jgi:hypothetical protein